MKHSRVFLAAVLYLAASSFPLLGGTWPLPDSGLALWLKADAGVTKDGAGLVSAWDDQSGCGNSVATALGQPTFVQDYANGLPAVRFSHANDAMLASRLVFNGSGLFTTFSSIRCNAVAPQQTIFWQGDSSGSGGYGARLVNSCLGQTTDSHVQFLSGTPATAAGVYSVTVLTAATKARVVSEVDLDVAPIVTAGTLAINGVYIDVSMGDGAPMLAARINVVSDSTHVMAIPAGGGLIRLEHMDYGSSHTITISGTAGTLTEIGLRATTVSNGTDVFVNLVHNGKVFGMGGDGAVVTWEPGTDAAGLSLYVTANPGPHGSVIVTKTAELAAGWGASTASVSTDAAQNLGNWCVVTTDYDSSTHSMWVDGVAAGSVAKSDSNLASGVFCLGNYWTGQYSLNGDLGEIIVYNRSLTEEERQCVESYLSTRWAALPIARLADAKALPDGVALRLTTPKVVTVPISTFSDGSRYIEDADRSCGIKVKGASLSIWQNVRVTGTLATDQNGERILNVSRVDGSSQDTEVRALGMSNKSVSASGLLVRVWGRVTEKTDTHLTIDDGSGAPVRVELAGLVWPISNLPDVNQYIAATGNSGYATGGVKVVRVRSSEDISIY